DYYCSSRDSSGNYVF
nr:immunoglobulin light chain junction region [Macaca mulatta]MOV72494.1 immunoglobulin light chain junction region [Macaca mulatta]MOV73416.1 immunoglobulin light chain junction region [Macaca mulatta]MOV73779.1 immunoglobulin light chain junction region [Macaca mulatta]MOV73940.1 immunoglobulin light chain junction region [Macaca mulatta]